MSEKYAVLPPESYRLPENCGFSGCLKATAFHRSVAFASLADCLWKNWSRRRDLNPWPTVYELIVGLSPLFADIRLYDFLFSRPRKSAISSSFSRSDCLSKQNRSPRIEKRCATNVTTMLPPASDGDMRPHRIMSSRGEAKTDGKEATEHQCMAPVFNYPDVILAHYGCFLYPDVESNQHTPN